MNDLERWIHLEGPEPAGIKELMDAGRAAFGRTPEEKAANRRALIAALAEGRRRAKARARARGAVCAAALVAAAAGAWLVLARRGAAPVEPAIAREAPSSVAPTPGPEPKAEEPRAPEVPAASAPAPRIAPRIAPRRGSGTP